MNDIANSIVLSPFFQPNSSEDFEEKLNENEGKSEAFSSQAEENFKLENSEKISDAADHIVLSPFFQPSSSSENEEENDTNEGFCGNINESSRSQPEENFESQNSEEMSETTGPIRSPFSQHRSSGKNEEKGITDFAICGGKNELSNSQSEENLKMKSCEKISGITDPIIPSPFFCHSLSSDMPVKKEREEQPGTKFTTCEDNNVSENEEKFKTENSGEFYSEKFSDFTEPVTYSPFFHHSLSGDILVKKENEEKPDVKFTVFNDENKSSISQDEKNSEIKNAEKINDTTDLTIPNLLLHPNSSNDIPMTKKSGGKPNVKEDINKSSSSQGEESSVIGNSEKINNTSDSIIPGPFFCNSEMKKSEKKLNVKSTDCEDESKCSNEHGAGIKSVSKSSRKPRKRQSTVKKDPGRKKVVTSPYFAAEVNSPDKESAKSGDKKRSGKKWIPPRSPYSLIQEDLYDKPWQLLIATIFLTKTRGQLAIPFIHKFLAKWPTPESLLEANFEEVHEIFQPLGLGMVRSCSVFRFTKEFVEKDWQYPIELHGIGKYGNDSYRMFCVNEWREVTPTDIPLSMYREWLTANQEKLGLK